MGGVGVDKGVTLWLDRPSELPARLSGNTHVYPNPYRHSRWLMNEALLALALFALAAFLLMIDTDD